MRYQPHIDGLRAIAVLSVVFYHLDISLFSGGYIGVDIFFVISGYLISSIIYREVQNTGQFSFSNFYIRRARRLLPALFATLILSAIVATILFSSQRLADFGLQLIYSVLSISNFYFWLQSGYFDIAAESKALLHMWSLSVEEQFYLVWPLLIFLGFRYLSEARFLIALTIIFIASLALNFVVGTTEIRGFYNQESAMFYLTPFRVYEFVIGAAGIWLTRIVSTKRLVHELMFIIGLCGVVVSLTQMKSGILFPYYYALLPCLSTLLLILGKNSLLCKFVLENRFAIFFGVISYTLYLVHWPVIVFLKYYKFAPLTLQDSVLALIIMAVISVLIFYLIEQPLRTPPSSETEKRRPLKYPTKPFLYGCLGGAVITISLGVLYFMSAGLSGLKNEVLSSAQIDRGKQDRYLLIKNACRVQDLDASNCHLDRPLQVLVIGNSHEPDGYNIFHSLLEGRNDANLILFGGTNFCDISTLENGIFSSAIKRNQCDLRTQSLNDKRLLSQIDTVVFSSNRPFAHNKQRTWKILEELQRKNPDLKILVLGTYFNTHRECSEIANRFGTTSACADETLASFIGRDERMNNHLKSVTESIQYEYLDKFIALCENPNELNSCPTEHFGEPMFYDQHHISLGFTKLIAQRFEEVYSAELTASKILE